VQGRLGEFEARGVQVVAVGQGTGKEAAAAARRHRITYPCLGDPGHRSYRTLGLGRTGLFGLTLQPFLENTREAFQNLSRADLRASANPRSDVRRLGGAMTVDATGRIRFLHRSRTTTDTPNTNSLLGSVSGG
jgi:hypothetical protein